MNEKEVFYQRMLRNDKHWANRCYDCGCTPKNDEWSNREKNLCIDCHLDDEEERDDCG